METAARLSTAYPQQFNGTYVAMDMICTDGTTLRDSNARDQWGIRVHPSAQGDGGRLTVNTWKQVRSNIGQWLAGRSIDRILAAYDRLPRPLASFGLLRRHYHYEWDAPLTRNVERSAASVLK